MRSALLTALCFLAARLPGAESPPWMVIAQPGYPGSTADAAGFMEQLTGHLASTAKLPGLTGEYHNELGKALAAIEEKKPAFGIVSLGFYLEHRRKLGLRPLCQSKPGDNFVLIAPQGSIVGVQALAGKSVAGGALYERSYLERIVFRGKADVASWDAKPTLVPLRSVRQMVRQKNPAAVLLTGREYRSLLQTGLYPPKTLEKMMESDYYPAALVVAFGTPKEGSSAASSKGEGQKGGGASAEAPASPGGAEKKAPAPLPAGVVESVVRALLDLSRDPQGKKILETMGTEGFEEIPAGSLEKLEGEYDGTGEKK